MAADHRPAPDVFDTSADAPVARDRAGRLTDAEALACQRLLDDAYAARCAVAAREAAAGPVEPGQELPALPAE